MQLFIVASKLLNNDFLLADSNPVHDVVLIEQLDWVLTVEYHFILVLIQQDFSLSLLVYTRNIIQSGLTQFNHHEGQVELLVLNVSVISFGIKVPLHKFF